MARPNHRFAGDPTGEDPDQDFDAHDDAGQFGDAQPAGPEALRQVRAEFDRLVKLARFYLAARTDSIQAGARRVAILTAMGLVALFALMTMVAVAVVVLVLGIAEGIGEALGGRVWAGNLITGVVLLSIFAVTALWALKWIDRTFRERTVRKYERRQQQAGLRPDASQRNRS